MLIGVSAGAALCAALSVPMSTRQGVNFTVSTRTVPFYVKAIDFLHRHYRYQALAEMITRGRRSDRDRVLAVFDWTRRNIRPTPRGWPIVDDHILDIIVRGYGVDDQMADVFTTLSTYGGVPAFWKMVTVPERETTLILSFARVDGVWVTFDVAHGLIFTDVHGRLIDTPTLAHNPAAAQAIAGELQPGGIPYGRYLEQLRVFEVPKMLRARKQMPLPRLIYEGLRGFRRTP